VKREKSEANSSAMAKKSIERKKLLKQQHSHFLMQDKSYDELLMMQQLNDSFQTKGAPININDNKHKFRSMAPHGSLAVAGHNLDETASFEQKLQGLVGH